MPLILFNKPFRVLSQFRDREGRAVLADYIGAKHVYPAGRLDYDSEGLILLTDDGALQAAIAAPASRLGKYYWVQVEGAATGSQLRQLCEGVELRDGPAAAITAEAIAEPAGLWPRTPPIRSRRNIPTSWLSLTIDEGRNRQVRRMTAAAGLPTLRLIRYRIGPWDLGGLRTGEHRSVQLRDARRQLRDWRQSPLP